MKSLCREIRKRGTKGDEREEKVRGGRGMRDKRKWNREEGKKRREEEIRRREEGSGKRREEGMNKQK